MEGFPIAGYCIEQSSPEYAAEVNRIIENLILRNDTNALQETLRSLGPYENVKFLNSVQVAFAMIMYSQGAYENLIDFLQSFNFYPSSHPRLQMLWNESHYRIAEKLGPLGAVGRYRLRRKYMYPRTIWDGENMSHNVKYSSRETLNEFFKTCAYPTCVQKLELAKKTGLSTQQVINWFKNKRSRSRAEGVAVPQEETKLQNLKRRASSLGTAGPSLGAHRTNKPRVLGHTMQALNRAMVRQPLVFKQLELLQETRRNQESDPAGGQLRNSAALILPETKKPGNVSEENKELGNSELRKLLQAPQTPRLKKRLVWQNEAISMPLIEDPGVGPVVPLNPTVLMNVTQNSTTESPRQPVSANMPIYQTEVIKQIRICPPYPGKGQSINGGSNPEYNSVVAYPLPQNGIALLNIDQRKDGITEVLHYSVYQQESLQTNLVPTPAIKPSSSYQYNMEPVNSELRKYSGTELVQYPLYQNNVDSNGAVQVNNGVGMEACPLSSTTVVMNSSNENVNGITEYPAYENGAGQINNNPKPSNEMTRRSNSQAVKLVTACLNQFEAAPPKSEENPNCTDVSEASNNIV